MATLNYMLENYTGRIVFDNWDPSKEWYQSELTQTALDIEKSRSKQIKSRLDKHFESIKSRLDPNFKKYIKLHTGYDINIFEELKMNILPIVEKGVIEGNDSYHIERFLKVYETDIEEGTNVGVLSKLLKELNAKREAEIASLVSLGGEIETIYVIGDKVISEAEYKTYLHKWQLFKDTSPNGLNFVSVEFSGTADCALTFVVISLPGGSGSIYCAKGEKLPIKAYWKDNHTVVVETKSEYKYLNKHHKVRSYDEVVKIEYVVVNS